MSFSMQLHQRYNHVHRNFICPKDYCQRCNVPVSNQIRPLYILCLLLLGKKWQSLLSQLSDNPVSNETRMQTWEIKFKLKGRRQRLFILLCNYILLQCVTWKQYWCIQDATEKNAERIISVPQYLAVSVQHRPAVQNNPPRRFAL